MSKLTVIATSTPPPPKYRLELDEEEAGAILTLVAGCRGNYDAVMRVYQSLKKDVIKRGILTGGSYFVDYQ